MNYLAHILLSESNIDYQLGNLLADPLKGKSWVGATSAHLAGMEMHVKIDAFTDSNAIVSRSKSRLREKGYLKGVVIDVIYDHFLTKHWDRFSSEEYERFINQFQEDATRRADTLPEEAGRFIENIKSNSILSSYKQMSGVEQALKRIDHRLSARVLSKESASGYMSVVEKTYGSIESDFLLFFPQLVEMFLKKTCNNDHCLQITGVT